MAPGMWSAFSCLCFGGRTYALVALVDQLRQDVGDGIEDGRLRDRHGQLRGHNGGRLNIALNPNLLDILTAEWGAKTRNRVLTKMRSSA